MAKKNNKNKKFKNNVLSTKQYRDAKLASKRSKGARGKKIKNKKKK